jgi:hypothetical protein
MPWAASGRALAALLVPLLSTPHSIASLEPDGNGDRWQPDKTLIAQSCSTSGGWPGTSPYELHAPGAIISQAISSRLDAAGVSVKSDDSEVISRLGAAQGTRVSCLESLEKACGHVHMHCEPQLNGSGFPCPACKACVRGIAGCSAEAKQRFCSQSNQGQRCDYSGDPQGLPAGPIDTMPPGTDGVSAFRIPSVLYLRESRTVLIFAEARGLNHSDSGDNSGMHALAMARSTDTGRSWLPLRYLYNDSDPTRKYGGLNLGASVYDRQRDAVHILFNECGFQFNNTQLWPKCGPTAQLLMLSSTTQGRTWGSVHNLTDTFVDAGWSTVSPGPGTGIQLANGRLLVAVFGMLKGVRMPYSGAQFDPLIFQIATLYSDDGVRWRMGEKIPNPLKAMVDEDQVALLSNGAVLINARAEHDPRRYLATSTDRGQSFSPLEPRGELMLGANCQGSTISVNGTLFFSHPSTPYGNLDSDSGRMNGWIKFSIDLGQTWWLWRQVEPMSFAYSSLTLIGTNESAGTVTLGIVYEGTVSGAPVVAPFYDVSTIMWATVTGPLPRAS